MGVDAVEIKEPFTADMKSVGIDDLYKRLLPDTIEEFIVLEPQHNNSYMAAASLLKKGIETWRNFDDPSVPKGAFIVKKSAALEALKEINLSMPQVLSSFPTLPLEKYKKLKPFKVALYQNYGHNMYEGWTRYVFDEFKIDYETVHAKDFQKKDFLKKFDIVVFVGASQTEIESGKLPKKWEKWETPMPPEYSGGIEEKGKDALKEFLKAGKTLIFMGESCEYPLENFKLPVENIVKESSKVSCPGSYLSVDVKEGELTYGMPAKAAVFYNEDPVFSTSLTNGVDQDRRTAVIFSARDLLLSGALEGEEVIARKAVVVDFTMEKGRIILVGPDMVFRTQSEGTYKILFNSLFTAAK